MHIDVLAQAIRGFLHRFRSDADASSSGSDCAAVIETKVRLAGRTLRLLVRHGTDDAAMVRRVMRLGSPLAIPSEVSPTVIFDLNAGVGAAVIFDSMLHPQAHIYAFAADPQQEELLRANAQRHSLRIQVVPVKWDDPDTNVGGFRLGVESAAQQAIEGVLTEHNLTAVDVVRVDADAIGAAMLRAVPEEIRRTTGVVIGRGRGLGRPVVQDLLRESHLWSLRDPEETFVALNRERAAAEMGPLTRRAG